MGYTTKFEGEFTVVWQKTNEPVDFLSRLIQNSIDNHYMSANWRSDKTRGNEPDTYCQWILKRKNNTYTIGWDEGEKFYKYEEWLQYILDTHLIPFGLSLSGNVRYQGEEIGDSGILTIKNDKVVALTMDNAFKDMPQSTSSIDIQELESINQEFGDLMNKLVSVTGIIDDLQDRLFELIQKAKKK